MGNIVLEFNCHHLRISECLLKSVVKTSRNTSLFSARGPRNQPERAFHSASYCCPFAETESLVPRVLEEKEGVKIILHTFFARIT